MPKASSEDALERFFAVDQISGRRLHVKGDDTANLRVVEAATGMQQAVLSRIATGRQVPDAAQVQRLATYFRSPQRAVVALARKSVLAALRRLEGQIRDE